VQEVFRLLAVQLGVAQVNQDQVHIGAAEFTEVAEIIATALKAGTSADVEALQARVDQLAADFPLYPTHEQW
jgi:glycine/serine hydroxymethyltransferase